MVFHCSIGCGLVAALGISVPWTNWIDPDAYKIDFCERRNQASKIAVRLEWLSTIFRKQEAEHTERKLQSMRERLYSMDWTDNCRE